MPSKKIEKLTPEQEAMIPVYQEKYTELMKNTKSILDTAEWDKIVDVVKEIYDNNNLKHPINFYYCVSPDAACKMIAEKQQEYLAAGKIKKEQVKEYKPQFGGTNSAPFTSFYDYFRTECGIIEETNQITGLIKAAFLTGHLYLFDECAFIVDRPKFIIRDQLERLHRQDGPAVEWRDGTGIYYWAGTKIPKDMIWIIDEPGKITLENVIKEDNAEIKRIMMKKIGIDKLLNANEVVTIEDDPQYGTLYHTKRLRDMNNAPFAFVKLINRTPEILDELSQQLMEIDAKIKHYNFKMLQEKDKTYIDDFCKNGYVEYPTEKMSLQEAEELLNEDKILTSFEKEDYLTLFINAKELWKKARIEKKIYVQRVDPKIKTVKMAVESFRRFPNFNPIVAT